MGKSDDAKKKLLVVTAVWGEWHIAKYLELNLPTLLAEGNFPALAKHCDITYLLYTSKADLPRLKQAPGLAALARLMKLDFRTIDAAALSEPLAAHHQVWNEAAAQAKSQKSFIVLMPPDVAWSNGSFAHVGRKLQEGKQAIFMTYLRVESESFMAALASHRDAHTGIIDVSGAKMVELSLRTLHALMPAYLRDSHQFPIHPEMMFWAIPGEGLLCRVLAREMFVYDPAKLKLTVSHLLDTRLDPALIDVVQDSDDLFGVSLTPLTKDLDWYHLARRAVPAEIAEWWLEYDSWVNDIVSRASMRWHYAPVTDSAWRAKERGADLFLSRAAALREAHRIYRAARKVECTVAAGLLAIATQSGLLQRAARPYGGVTVFLPTDEAFAREMPGALERLGSVAGERELLRFLRAHFVPGGSVEPVRALDDRLSAGSLQLSDANGAPLQVVQRDGRLEVNGRVIQGKPVRSGSHLVYRIDGLLPAAMSRPRAMPEVATS
jgi:uncharacterized surface protein with fasciclin (FAS1) repeats